MTRAVTYQAGPRKSDFRTVLVDDLRQASLLLPTGRIDVVQGTLLHGTSCRHSWWAEVLGTDPADDTFLAPAEVVRQVREMTVAVKVKNCK
jgi:hypothetical protein